MVTFTLCLLFTIIIIIIIIIFFFFLLVAVAELEAPEVEDALERKVAAVDVVAQEEVARVLGVAAHGEQLDQVEKLPVNVTHNRHCTQKKERRTKKKKKKGGKKEGRKEGSRSKYMVMIWP